MDSIAIEQSVCLVIPAFEPTPELVALVQNVMPAWGGPVVMVDDGSATPGALDVFSQVKSMGCTVLSHNENKGKGAALKTALSWCAQHAPKGYVGVVTADADGQHTPEDILAVRAALTQHPHALVLGCRNFDGDDVPSRSKAGNKTMSFAMRALFGMRISDTQTGLRGIPREFAAELLHVSGNGYAFETNMLIEAHNDGVSIVEVPIRTVYVNDNEGSHFNPVLDSLRVAAIFIRYALSSMASSIVDLAAFALFNALFVAAGLGLASIAAATFAARIVSGAANFLINRHLVFKRGNVKRGAVRYAVLWASCACASAALVTGVSSLVLFIPSIVIKAIVDVALFFVNYRIQESWVFKADRAINDAE